MNFETNEVYTIKLANGDELIGKVERQLPTDSTVIIKAPLIVMFTGQGIQLMPALFTVDPEGKMEVNTNMIVAKATPRKEIVDHYVQATSGIALAPGSSTSKNLILG